MGDGVQERGFEALTLAVRFGAAELFDPAMRELVIDDPTDLSALVAGLNTLLRVKQDLRSVARATAEKFTWDAYGANLLKLIASL